MNERSLQHEVVRSVAQWGGYAHKVMDGHVCPQCKHIAIPSAGRADYDCTLGRIGFKVEVKYAEKSFPLANLREDQREWAKWYVQETGGLYFLWLCMGDRIHSTKLPRRTWMVPLRDWLALEAIVLTYQKSLPYRASKGYSKEMQQAGIDAAHLLQDFGLDWIGRGRWIPRRDLFSTE